MKKFKLLWLLAAACSLTFASCNKDNDGPDTSTTVTFESAVLPDVGYINNTSYTEQGVTFNNVYDVQGQYMSAGFAVSKLHDKVTAGYTNMYSVYGDGGAAGSVNFAVCYFAEYLTNTSGVNDAYFAFGAGIERKMLNVMVNNGTYAYLAIKNRNDGSNPPRVKEFTDGDWFKVVITLRGPRPMLWIIIWPTTVTVKILFARLGRMWTCPGSVRSTKSLSVCHRAIAVNGV